jgi:site-specific recombinase XerD
VKAVQRMLGHASAAVTLDVYSDLFDNDLDAVSAALDNEIARTSSSARAQQSPKAINRVETSAPLVVAQR